MITKNYLCTLDGKLVASGDGVATITANSICQWAIGDSAVAAPTVSPRHNARFFENVSMSLGAGEYLWVFGAEVIAVTATNAAAGDI